MLMSGYNNTTYKPIKVLSFGEFVLVKIYLEIILPLINTQATSKIYICFTTIF